MKRLALSTLVVGVLFFNGIDAEASDYIRYNRECDMYTFDTDEQIEEEIRLGEMELLAQLIEAEAGNQDMKGKRLVGDVVMNRCKKFGRSVEEVIFEDFQFSCINDGGFDDAGWYISEDSFEAAKLCYEGETLDNKIIFFTAGHYNPYCTPAYVYGAHYFGY